MKFAIRLLFFVIIVLGCRDKNVEPGPAAVSEEQQFYEIKGEGELSLVFIHGWNINRSYWKKQTTYFSKTYKTVAIDLLTSSDMGDSLRNWTIEEFADDIIEIIEKEKLDKLILVGHSMSGEICLELNKKIPDKVVGIVGVDNFKELEFELENYDPKEIDAFIDDLRANYSNQIGSMVDRLFPIENRNEEAYQRVLNDFQAANPRIATAIFRNMYEVWDNTKSILPELQHPLRIIMCDFSEYSEKGFEKYAVNGYEIIEIEDSGHYPMIEQPEKFNEALDTFLEQIKQGL